MTLIVYFVGYILAAWLGGSYFSEMLSFNFISWSLGFIAAAGALTVLFEAIAKGDVVDNGFKLVGPVGARIRNVYRLDEISVVPNRTVNLRFDLVNTGPGFRIVTFLILLVFGYCIGFVYYMARPDIESYTISENLPLKVMTKGGHVYVVNTGKDVLEHAKVSCSVFYAEDATKIGKDFTMEVGKYQFTLPGQYASQRMVSDSEFATLNANPNTMNCDVLEATFRQKLRIKADLRLANHGKGGLEFMVTNNEAYAIGGVEVLCVDSSEADSEKNMKIRAEAVKLIADGGNQVAPGATQKFTGNNLGRNLTGCMLLRAQEV